jgi:hypothetical protein
MALSPNHCSSGKTTLHIVCVAETHVTVSYIKILRIAQKCFYGKFISPKTIVRLPYVMWPMTHWDKRIEAKECGGLLCTDTRPPGNRHITTYNAEFINNCIRFACNSAGTEELPDDDTHVSKHVGAAEWNSKTLKLVHLLVIYKHRTKMHGIKIKII